MCSAAWPAGLRREGPADASGRSRARRPALVAAVLLGTVSGACVPLDDFMGDVFGRSMRDQPSFDPYENVLLPPEGSIPFAAGNYPAGPYDVNVGQPEGSADLPPPFTMEDMTDRPNLLDGLVNPVPPTAASLARGEELYERVCIVCHGPDGAGTTGYIFEVHPAMAAHSLTAESALGRSDGYIYGMIRVGRVLMPGYGHQIAHYDRWHVVNYVRQLQGLLEEGTDGEGAEAEAAAADEPVGAAGGLN